jgi:hypothetical protein
VKRYTLTYVNPNSSDPTREYTAGYETKAQLDAVLKRYRRYSGSFQIVRIEKKTAAGREVMSF